MNRDQIGEDLRFLAGTLPHRDAFSPEEREAADYAAARLRRSNPLTHLEPFGAFESHRQLFAAYYGEFLVVAFIAIWWPRVAFVYGALVFLGYVAEFMGFRLLSRFLPEYASHNVQARFLGTRPRCEIVVTAGLDSGRASSLTRPRLLPWLRWIHLGLLGCMLLTAGTAAAEALGILGPAAEAYLPIARWLAAGLLGTAALYLLYTGVEAEETRGANMNASGAAAALALAEALRERPVEEADVLVALTGAQEAWMAGARHLLGSTSFDTGRTYWLNIEAVGSGQLHYLTAEGFLNLNRADPRMIACAEAEAPSHGATPRYLRAAPTGAHPVHARGLRAMTIMALGPSGVPGPWHGVEDTLAAVDAEQVARAARFAEGIVRRLAEGAA